MERRKAPGDQITEVIPGNGDTDTFCLSSSILFIINLRSCCVFCVIIAGLIQLLSVFLSSPSLLMKVVVCGEEEKNKVPETRADKKGLLNCQLRVGPFTRGRSLVDTETGILGEAAQSAPCYASAASWPHHNLHPDPETAGEGLMYRVMPHILTWSPLCIRRNVSETVTMFPQPPPPPTNGVSGVKEFSDPWTVHCACVLCNVNNDWSGPVSGSDEALVSARPGPGPLCLVSSSAFLAATQAGQWTAA